MKNILFGLAMLLAATVPAAAKGIVKAPSAQDPDEGEK